ncbi:MAG: MATE family efflux transporter [Agathobacter sp.]
MSKMQKNLTTGNIFKTIISFCLPFLLSYFLQTLYGMADLFIIGQFNGVESTTAVSIGSQVMHMITVMIVGLAMGTTVMIGQAIGAEKKEDVTAAISNTVVLFFVLSIAATVLLLCLVRPITTLMSTPKEAVQGTISYLTICFMGIPFITAYNVISSIFRGMGDSRSPMYFIAVSCAVNIGLDFLLIGGFHMGAAGAALGTTLSQTFSVFVSLAFIAKNKSGITLNRKNFHLNRKIMSSILKIGFPVAVQDGFIQIAFLVITVIANRRGLNDAAAVGIVEKIISILFLVNSTMLSTVSALCAQNIGAGKHDRAKQTLKYAILITSTFGLISVIIMQLAPEPFIGMFTSDAEVIRMGAQYMHGYVFDCILAGIHFCFSGYFCAYGKSWISFVHNVAAILCARIPLAYLASVYFPDTLLPMGLATSTGSLVSVVICIFFFLWMQRHTKETK